MPTFALPVGILVNSSRLGDRDLSVSLRSSAEPTVGKVNCVLGRSNRTDVGPRNAGLRIAMSWGIWAIKVRGN